MANYVHYQEYFKSFLGGWSFENGDKTLTISKIGEEEMYDANTGGKKTGLVMHFEEENLPMVLNVTNCETIAEVIGTENVVPLGDGFVDNLAAKAVSCLAARAARMDSDSVPGVASQSLSEDFSWSLTAARELDFLL